MTVLSALSLCLLSVVPTSPQDRAWGFLQTVREQMVTGSAFRGSGGVPAIVYQNENGITMQSSRGPLSDMYFLVPLGSRGYVLSGASFSTGREERVVDDARAFDRARIPSILNSLAATAGLQANPQVREIRRVEDRVEITADQTYHGVLVSPGSGVFVALDYETAQVREWSGMVQEMPQGPPPPPADISLVRNRILYDLLINHGVPSVSDVRVRPVVYVLSVWNNNNPEFRTLATGEEIAAARERRARYTWMLTSRSSEGGWADGYADYGSGRLLETMRISRGGGATAKMPIANLPMRGKYRILRGSETYTQEGRLVPVAASSLVRGDALGLVAGGVAVRAVYDPKQDVLQTSQGTFRPVGGLRAALRAMRR